MKKDAYYFPHFSNARNDAKLIKLRRVMGIEGYGMYFLLLEVLREQTDFKLPITSLEDLAFEWHTSKEKLFAIVTNFDLFNIENDIFFSPKLILYLQPYIEKSERARLAAKKRWNNANALQMHSKSNANALHEHSICYASKVKESKVKEKNITYDAQNEILNDSLKKEEIIELINDVKTYFPTEIFKSATKKTKIEWMTTIDKLNRLDSLKTHEIKNIIIWARKNDFWRKNFLSISKLRKKDKSGVPYWLIFKTQMENENKSNRDIKLDRDFKYTNEI